MRATFRPGAGRIATLRVRVTVPNGEAGSEVTITDVILQPGPPSAWLPHVSELPWSPGVTGGGP